MAQKRKLVVGMQAPNFTLPDQKGTLHTLSEARGHAVLVYFYPKDDTSGCTTEACMIRDNFPAFKKLRIAVFGVSIDSIKSHEQFAAKYHLPFPLLADEKKEVVKKYGVYQKKKMMGREYMGTVRTSFLIDPAGEIAKIYERVNPVVHAGEVLADISRLGYK